MEVDPLFTPLHADLTYELEVKGFLECENGVWSGTVSHDDGRSWPVEINMRSGYPTYPPSVKRKDSAPLTWHQNFDGSMCLYSQTQPGQFPWFQHGGLLTKITNWLVQADAGWPNETNPDLDLERYWEQSSRYKLLVHSDLSNWPVGKDLRFQWGNNSGVLFQAGIPHKAAKRNKKPRNVYGMLTDVGELIQPPRKWEDLQNLVSNLGKIESLVRSGRIKLLLVRYSRAGYKGILGLAMSVQYGLVSAKAINCAEWSEEITSLRAGPQAEVLQSSHIAIVGLGAVGSFVADGLFRSGARRLTLIDGDRLRPGNLVRHAASPDFIGLMKGEAMARTLGTDHKLISYHNTSLSTMIEARHVIEVADLVIDATANQVTTTLLREAAKDAKTQIFTVYLANQGRSHVVTVHPTSEEPDVEVTYMLPLADDGIEKGCGDPVSPTPPYAVQEVAAMACRKIVDFFIKGTAQSEVQEFL